MKNILITGGRVIDCTQNLDSTIDIFISNGKITKLEPKITDFPSDTIIVSAKKMIVSPGFIDMHCHLREPGYTKKETIYTATKSAAKGGFTTVCAMPNTEPAMDNPETIELVLEKAKTNGLIRVLPIAAATKKREGNELTNMHELSSLGVVGFSDDGDPISNPNMMRQALSYSLSTKLPIINHCEVKELSKNGMINEGRISMLLGLTGIPNSSEDSMVARDISLAETTGGKLHIAHASTSGTMELIALAKDKGLNVTCEATPHHLTLTDEFIFNKSKKTDPKNIVSNNPYDTNIKVAPPLRSQKDVDSLVKGLLNDTIDVIATDHAPHTNTDKNCTFEDAANGISNLETALASVLSLYHFKNVPLKKIVEKLTSSPAKLINRPDLGSLKLNTNADITIFDPDFEWVINSNTFSSKGKNTPLEGEKVRGKVFKTIFKGEIIE